MNGYGRGEDGRGQNKASVITRETFGMTLLLFSVLLLVISIIGSYILGEIGVAITAFLLGVFGFFAYPLLVFCIYLSIVMVSGKKLFSWRWVLRMSCIALSAFLIAHLGTSARFTADGYGAYLDGCFRAATESVSAATAGGAVFGLIVYPVRALITQAGGYVLFSLLLAVSVFFFLKATPLRNLFRRAPREERAPAEKKRKKRNVREENPAPERPARTIRRADPYGTTDEADLPYGGRSDPAYGYDRQPQPPQPPQPPASYYYDPYGMYGQPYSAPDPYSAQGGEYPVPPEPPAEPTGRDILFGNPARDYRTNLAFNRDRPVRRSSVVPDDAPSRKPDYDIPASYERNFDRPTPPRDVNYSDRYRSNTENGRPAMPRKIVEQRPDPPQSGYTVRAEDLNYTKKPSYKAPDVSPEPPPRDFYENDVEEEFSSAPNVHDETDDRTPDPDRSDRMRRAPLTPEEEPIKSEPAPDYPDFDRGDRSRDTFGEDGDRSRDVFGEDGDRSRGSFGEGGDRSRDTFGKDGDRSRGTFGESGDRSRDVFGEGGDRSRGTFGESGDRSRDVFGEDEDRFAEEDDPGESRALGGIRRDSGANLFDDDDLDEPMPPARSDRRSGSRSKPLSGAERHVYRPYRRPSREIFYQYDDTISVSQEEIDRNSQIIVKTLAGFHVDTEVKNVVIGPCVTRYDLDLPDKTTVSAFTRYIGEIALNLRSRGGVTMYPNNEKGKISIEVPNSVRSTVGLSSVMQAEEYLANQPDTLTFGIGKDIEGRNICGDIVKMKHLLVAGATGSGKSVCLNAMLISLICKYSPEDLRLILIDPKKVEFTIYDGLPHLMIKEVVADAQKAIMALNWAIKEMERRFDLFEQKTRGGVAVRNLDEYNSNLTEDEQKLPKIVIVVDELADLMSVAKKDIEERIQRIAQKARAAGIHLVIATQRPSVDVITGVIKGNLPTRMAFRVIQEVDSRTILDESGAEKLLGNGDMLFKTEGMFNCIRVQGAFISSAEVQAIVEDIKTNNEAYFDPEVDDYINRTDDGSEADDEDGGSGYNVDDQYIRALGIVVKLGSASISLIQRKCSVGYNHAGKIMEWMEDMQYVSPFDGKAKARTVLLTKEEFESKYGPLD